MNHSLSIVILAAGKGTRMKSNTPKVLHKIANKEMILHVIDACIKLKPKKIYVVLGSNRNNIINILPKKNVKIIIQENQLGTAHALLCAQEFLKKKKGKLLVLYGDVPLLEPKTLKKLAYSKHNDISMLGFSPKDPKGYGRVKFQNNKVSEVIEEKDLNSEESKLNICYSGIFAGDVNAIFKLMGKIKKNNTHNEFLLTDIFRLASKENNSASLVLASEYEVIGVNNFYQLSLAEEYFQNKIRKKFLLKGVLMKDPRSVFFSHDTKVASNVKIDINNNFGEGVVIKSLVHINSNNNIEYTIINEGAKVGPFSRLRDNVILGKKVKIGNFVEVKNSKIGDGSKINHLTYIGDSIIGSNTNIGAGTITCNYDGKNKNKTIIGDNVFVGSNCSLIAPIEIGNHSFIAAGSAISDNVERKDFSIARAKQKIIKDGSKKFLK